MKKIISLLMVLCLMASLCSMSAYADDRTVSTSAELIEAAGTAPDGSTITLAGPVTLDSNLSFNNEVSLKFNGNTIDAGGFTITLNKKFTILDAGVVTNPGSFSGDQYLVLANGLFPYAGELNGVAGLHVCSADTRPAKPNANVKVLDAENYGLHYAYEFQVGDNSPDQENFYSSWYVDFVIEFNKDVVFNADHTNGTANGYLAGQYDDYSLSWLKVPFTDVPISANTPFRIMNYAADNIHPGLKVNFTEVMALDTFRCGIYFNEDFLAANPDLVVKLSLNMYNPLNEDEYINIDSKVIEPKPVPTPEPKPVSEVPVTADNSNMPLWGVLFIGFAAVAVLTAKKKKA